MKLDYDCVRNIMLSIESLEQGQCLNDANCSAFPLLQKYSSEKVNYTIERLLEAGYIPNYRVTKLPYGGVYYDIDSLTWEGHQYLDCIRNNDVWDKTRKKVSLFDGVPFKIMIAIAKELISDKLGLPG